MLFSGFSSPLNISTAPKNTAYSMPTVTSVLTNCESAIVMQYALCNAWQIVSCHIFAI